MLIIPDALKIGGDHKGLRVTGAACIGCKNENSIRPEPTQQSINLLSEPLDSRIKFSCASARLAWNKDGNLERVAANVWPIEYKNGVAVGRHEPEPASDNYYTHSGRFAVRGVITDITEGPGIQSELLSETNENGSHYLTHNFSFNKGAKYSISFLVKKSATRGYVYINSSPLEVNGVSNQYCIVNLNDPSDIRYIADGGLPVSGYCHVALVDRGYIRVSINQNSNRTVKGNLIQIGTALIDGVISFVGSESASLILSAIQFENMPLSTSPMPDGYRYNSYVTIDTAEFKTITVHYSNGEKDRYVTPDSKFALPMAKRNWGERYITKIDFGV